MYCTGCVNAVLFSGYLFNLFTYGFGEDIVWYADTRKITKPIRDAGSTAVRTCEENMQQEEGAAGGSFGGTGGSDR